MGGGVGDRSNARCRIILKNSQNIMCMGYGEINRNINYIENSVTSITVASLYEYLQIYEF